MKQVTSSLVLATLLASSCGPAGIVTSVSSASGGGGGGDVNSPPQLSGVLIYSEQTSPAVIQFDLRDVERDPVSVAITFSPGGGQARDATLIPGDLQDLAGQVRLATAELGELSTSPAGETYHVLWDFEQDGLGPQLEETTTLFLDIVSGGGSAQQPLEPDPEPVAVGNDPPVFDPLIVLGEVSDIAFVPLVVNDTSVDSVLITIEYQIMGEDGCGKWQLARPAELPAGQPTTAGQIDTEADGEQEDFFWDTNYFESVPTPGCDIMDKDRRVKLRLTAVEELAHAGTGTTDEDVPLQGSIESA